MKTNKQNPDFLHIGEMLLKWYQSNWRNLPWRYTKKPYEIWICEIILQQTQVKQGLQYYLNFIERFPDVKSLHEAHTDDVLLYWKGLGYYSRALNLHKASHQIISDFGGKFPENFKDIIKLKGIGRYTAAAISSICFGEKIPAVDGNFYRVLSRVFADNYDVSQSSAFVYFSELALEIMPDNDPGDFNQAIMDLGSEVCKPKNPDCENCPIKNNCIAFGTGNAHKFPVKTKKIKTVDLFLKYYFVEYGNIFAIRQRKDDFIWKKLYEFPTEIPSHFEKNIVASKTLNHKLTHKNLTLHISRVVLDTEEIFEDFVENNDFLIVDFETSEQKSFPKPLHQYIKSLQ